MTLTLPIAEEVPDTAIALTGDATSDLSLPVILAEVVADRRQVVPRRGVVRAVLHSLGSAAEWLFGAASLVMLLAVLATVPMLNLLSLGYLLESSGRVSRSGRLRDGCIGVRKAGRVGGVLLGIGLWILPLQFVAEMWRASRLISGAESVVTQRWRVGLIVLAVLVAVHLAWACYRGGRLRHFFWPAPVKLLRTVLRGGMLANARDRWWNFVIGLRLPYYFWLGLRGFVGAVLWLLVPISLLAGASRLAEGPAALVGLIGGAMLAAVLLYLPFLQAHFAAERRFAALFELREVRGLFRRAPIAFWFALLVTLLFALPLYVLKIELTPRDAAWLPSLVFVAFIFPARLLTGWALGRALRRIERRHFLSVWLARLGMLPAVAIYTLLVYFTQYISWYGVWSLYEQHAFLVPAPFLEM